MDQLSAFIKKHRKLVLVAILLLIALFVHLLLRRPYRCSAILQLNAYIEPLLVGSGLFLAALVWMHHHKGDIAVWLTLCIVLLIIMGALLPCLPFKASAVQLLIPVDKEVYFGPDKAPRLEWKWYRKLQKNEDYRVVIGFETDSSHQNKAPIIKTTYETRLDLAGRYQEFMGEKANGGVFTWSVVVENRMGKAVSYQSKERAFIWREPPPPTLPSITSVPTTGTATPTGMATAISTHAPTAIPARMQTVTPTRTSAATLTATSTSTHTPTVTPTYTSTPMPTPTSTVTATHTPTATPTATFTPTPRYVPVLLEPIGRVKVDGYQVDLKWAYDRDLSNARDEAFGIEWSRGCESQPQLWEVAGPEERTFTIGRDRLGEAGDYAWSVVVIRGSTKKEIGPESDIACFHWMGAPGTFHVTPTPTPCHGTGCPTPEPTPTPCHGEGCP